jgi:hypothetical protein
MVTAFYNLINLLGQVLYRTVDQLNVKLTGTKQLTIFTGIYGSYHSILVNLLFYELPKKKDGSYIKR